MRKPVPEKAMRSGHRFGDFVLDSRRHALFRGDREVHLGERALDVLKLLVEKAGTVVSRRELMDAVWREVIVTDDSLARAVSDIRTALDDDAAHPQFIRTVHRRGYVFIASVTPLEEAEAEKVADGGRSGLSTRVLAVAVLVTIAVVLTLVVREVTRDSDEEGVLFRHDLSTWRLRALGPHPFAATAIKPAFAKKGDLLAVVAPDPETGVHSLYLLRPDGDEPLQLTRGMEVRGPSPEFTADDSHIIFTTYGSDPDRGMAPDVWLAPVPAGEPTLLMENASAASTSPDGRDLVYAAVTSRGTSIRVRSRDGHQREVAERGFWPRWSPTGEWIAYTTSDPEGGDGTIHVVRPDGSEHRELTHVSAQIYGLCWTHDGSRVIFASQQRGPMTLWAVEVASGEPQLVTRGPGECSAPAMAADGRRLVFDFSYRHWYLYLAPELEGPVRRVLVEPGMSAAALSPDGTRIAIALGSAMQPPAVSVLDLKTSKRRTLSGFAASAVAWMPDGSSLLVAAPAPDESRDWIWRLPVDGGLPEPVIKGDESWDSPSPSPDGTTIAVVRRSGTQAELVLHDLESGNTRTLAAKAVIEKPRWSPDGRHLAWSGSWRPDDASSGGVWTCPADGGVPRRLSADGAWPVWDADGESLLFTRFLEHEGIWRVPLAGGDVRFVRELDDVAEGFSLEGLDVGSAGTPLLFYLSKFTGELYVLEPSSG